jgi:hypothetical protein
VKKSFITNVSCLIFALGISNSVCAQDAPEQDAPEQATPAQVQEASVDQEQTSSDEPTAQSDQTQITPIDAEPSIVSSGQDSILRLEDTIRGNKEQPQVLTIVPWQLPKHQRINENSEWQTQVTQLSSIERNAFLRNLAVVKELNSASTQAGDPQN